MKSCIFHGNRAAAIQTDNGVMEVEGTVLLNEKELIITSD